MGHALTFDTHAYVKKLVTVGVSEKQAEVQAETLSQLLEDNLASKRDLKELEISLSHKMKELEISLSHKMKELEMRLTIQLGAIMAGGIVIVATLVKLL